MEHSLLNRLGAFHGVPKERNASGIGRTLLRPSWHTLAFAYQCFTSAFADSNRLSSIFVTKCAHGEHCLLRKRKGPHPAHLFVLQSSERAFCRLKSENTRARFPVLHVAVAEARHDNS